MAKKQKIKKSGIQKRKQVKQQKRASLKSKSSQKKPANKKLSLSKAKKIMAGIPGLIFEPELAECFFSSETIKELAVKYDKVPDQIERAADEDYVLRLTGQINKMQERFQEERDEQKLMMLQAVIYYIENNEFPTYYNQLIVSIYLKSIHDQSETPEITTLEELNQLLSDYETQWKDYLAEKMKQFGEDTANDSSADQSIDEQDSIDPDEEEELLDTEPSINYSLLADFLQTYEEKNPPEELMDRLEADLEAFLIDYLDGCEIGTMENCSSETLDAFLGEWFIQNMSPTKEDMSNMVDSLSILVDYAHEKNIVADSGYDELSKLLSDAQPYLDKLLV